jgi:hypothetical protein
MSWHCLPALAEESLGDASLVGELSAPSKWSPTLVLCCLPASATDALIRSLFGTTSEPSTESPGAAESMSSAADSPVKTSALPVEAPESTEFAQDSGPAWRGSLAKYDPDSSSWKTAQPSLLEELDESSVIWPRSGMTRSGTLYLLPTWERTIAANESGFLPTPTAGNFDAQDVPRLLARREAQKLKHGNGNGFGLTLNQWVKVQQFPTPRSSGSTMGGGANGRKAAEARGDLVLGSLNPPWVEWLMGWPSGWTDLRPLEMDRFHEWQRAHSTASGL